MSLLLIAASVWAALLAAIVVAVILLAAAEIGDDDLAEFRWFQLLGALAIAASFLLLSAVLYEWAV